MVEIRCPLAERAEKAGEDPAIIGPGEIISYRELDRRVSAIAMDLRERGFGEGDRVALFSPNGWEYAVVLLALFRMGAIACPLNTHIPPGGLGTLLGTIDCTRVISSGTALTEALPEAMIFHLEELAQGDFARHRYPPRAEILLERPATIVFTSGSTGNAKAVLHSYGNHFYNAKGSNLNIRMESGDRWLLSLPLYHVGGLGVLFRCLLSGAAVVLAGRSESLEGCIARCHVTHVSMVPTQLYRILRGKEGRMNLKGLKALLLGGAPVPSALLQEANEMGIPTYTSYGLTEMASQVTTTGTNCPPEKRVTAGQTLRYRQLRISEAGEILVRGETLFLGYVERNGIKLPVDSGGWFATGDLGRLDGDGYLTVLGRKDNMFVSGGENIHPEEIEAALEQLPEIVQSMVVPVPDEEFGNRPLAFVKTHEEKVNPEAIREHLKLLLPSYKIPVAFYDLPVHPGTGQLKLDRSSYKRLAAELWHRGGRR